MSVEIVLDEDELDAVIWPFRRAWLLYAAEWDDNAVLFGGESTLGRCVVTVGDLGRLLRHIRERLEPTAQIPVGSEVAERFIGELVRAIAEGQR